MRRIVGVPEAWKVSRRKPGYIFSRKLGASRKLVQIDGFGGVLQSLLSGLQKNGQIPKLLKAKACFCSETN